LRGCVVAHRDNDRMRKIVGRQVTTLAGGSEAGTADGAGADARFEQPFELAVDERGRRSWRIWCWWRRGSASLRIATCLRRGAGTFKGKVGSKGKGKDGGKGKEAGRRSRRRPESPFASEFLEW
jgi:hypothetical protein